MDSIRRFGKIVPQALVLVLGLVSLYFIYLRTRVGFWDYDGAIYVQPALSLARSFVYASISYPADIYANYITTNGPIQYLMAGALLAFDIETARIIVTVAVFAIFWSLAFYYSRIGAFLCSALLLGWPIFLECATRFWGELPAVIFCLLGIIFTEKGLKKNSNKTPLLGTICFGLAISTKLITLALVPFLILYSIEKTGKIRLAHQLRLALKCYLISLCTFVLLYYFAVGHSLLVMKLSSQKPDFDQTRWLGLVSFIRFHFDIARGEVHLSHDPRQIFAYMPYLFAFLITSIVAGARLYRSLLFFAFGYLILFLFAHLYERRIFPYLFFLLFLGSIALGSIVKNHWDKNRKRIAVAVSAVYLTSFIFPVLRAWPAILHSVQYTLQAQNLADSKTRNAHRYGKILNFLPYVEYPVLVTDGGRLPDLSLVTGIKFYFRFEPANRDLLKKYKKAYLLFQNAEGKDSFTSKTLCQKILVEDNGITLCEFDRSLAIDAIPIARQFTD